MKTIDKIKIRAKKITDSYIFDECIALLGYICLIFGTMGIVSVILNS